MLKKVFNLFRKRAPEPPRPLRDTPDFEAQIETRFDAKTAQAVRAAFEDLCLPLPKSADEYLSATLGALVFVSRFGVVIRVEKDSSAYNKKNADNPWELQPLGAIKAGDALVEICPGTHQARRQSDVVTVREAMSESGGVSFSDTQTANVGLLPFKTLRFPRGIPVAIDRPSVCNFSTNVQDVKKALGLMHVRRDPQDILYGDLRRAFRAAMNDNGNGREKMRVFWQMCEEARAKGTLVAGWSRPEPGGAFFKQQVAAKASLSYGQRVAGLKIP